MLCVRERIIVPSANSLAIMTYLTYLDTPNRVIADCKRRLRAYDAAAREE